MKTKAGSVSVVEARLLEAGVNPERAAAFYQAVRAGLIPADVSKALAMRDRGFEVRNEGDAGAAAPTVRIYGPIGGWFGVWPEELAAELDEIDAERVTVRINSPGGSVFDGIAIHNLIKDHPAGMDVIVDGLAASAASFVAQAGDHIVMNTGAEMMIHNAWMYTAGDAKQLRADADILDRQGLKVARIYHGRAGGTVDEWLAAMDAETWYLGDEAVAAGLADEAVDAPADDDDGGQNATRWDVSVFGFVHQGRGDAPDPFIPNETSTSVAPQAAPAESAAEAADRLAAARQRSTSVVAMARASLALADN